MIKAMFFPSIQCPKCGFGMRCPRPGTTYGIVCTNKKCELYGIHFEQPTLELDRSESEGVDK